MRNCISLILALAILLVGTAVPTYSLGETSDAQGKMLKVEADPTNGSIGYIYLTPGMLCQEGDYLEYDVYLMKDTSGIGGVDICYSTNLNCRDDAGFIDQNDISGHPAADISDYAYMQWYSRKLPITGNVIGTAGDIVIAFEGLTENAEYYLDNIRITRNGKTLGYAFKDGEDEYSFMGNTYADTNGAGITVSVVDANQLPVIIHQTDIDNVKNDLSSFSELAEVGEDEVKEVTSVIESYDHLTLDDRKNIDGSMAENLRRLLDQYNSVEYGDVDLNGSISSGDALLALQASVQKISLSKLQTKAADVDQKKGVTSADALLILQKSVGKIRIFPCVNESMLPGGLNLELSTGDSKVNVRVLNNVPSITYLATLSKNDNYVIKPVAINLPDSYSVDNGAYSGFDWKYAGYENFSDSETNTSGYKIKFTDDYLNVAYYMYVVTVGTLNGPFQFYGEIVNSSGKDFVILMDDIFDVSVTSEGTPTAWAFETEGQKASENGIIKTEMTPGASFTANCTTSQSGEGYIPIIYLDYASESGVYTALEWPSGNVNVRCISEKSVNLSVKLAGGFKTKITEDMVFQVPAVYLGVFDGDMDDGSNIFKRWFFDCKVPEVLRENPNEPLTQMDMQIGLETDRVGGVESVKWDNGWWAGSDQKLPMGWGKIEGDWNEVRDPKYINTINAYGCSDLKEFAALCKERGLNLTTYVLLHDAKNENPEALTSLGPNGHPEWFTYYTNTDGNFADLGNTNCVEWLKTKLLRFFKGNGVPTWRTDFEPIVQDSDKENRHFAHGNDVQYWCATGFYEIIDYLYDNYDEFRYENCSSGGSLKDFATMSRAVIINNDDSADFNSLRATFYDSSYCLPPAQLQAPTNPDKFMKGSSYYTNAGDADFGFRSIILGTLSTGSWSGPKDGKLQFGLEEYYNKYYTMYREKIRPLVRDGDLYHILPRPNGVDWDGVQYADKDSENEIKGAAFLFKPSDMADETQKIVFRGLNADETYQLEFEDHPEQNCAVLGQTLMTEGIEVKLTESIDSEIIWIKSAN